MPLYDLICDCGHLEIDAQMSVAEYGKVKCPGCGKKLKSRPHSLTVKLKGFGWTPHMTGPERFRERDKVIGEAQYTYKKSEEGKEVARIRREEKRPIYIT